MATGHPPVASSHAGIERSYVCVGCGAPMIEIGCKIRCRACGYFEVCGNGLTPPPVDAKPAWRAIDQSNARPPVWQGVTSGPGSRGIDGLVQLAAAAEMRADCGRLRALRHAAFEA